MMKKNTKNTHTQETSKLRTNVNIEWDWKQREDWRLGFKKLRKNTTLQFIYVSNVLSYHASPAESTVMNSFPWILQTHASSECPGVVEIVSDFIYNPSHLERIRRSSGSFLVVWLCPKAEILLCCYVRLFVPFFWMWDWINDDLSCWLRWVKDLPSSTVSVASESVPSHHWSHTDQTISALLMSASGSPLHSQRSTFLSLAPLFAKSDVSAFSRFPLVPLYLSIHLLSLCESAALRGGGSFLWTPAIGHDMMGQATNQ